MRSNHHAETSKLRSALSPFLDKCVFEESEHGQSGARVIRVLMPEGDVAFLKYGSGTFGDEIREEHERLEWLRSHVSVPAVISYCTSSDATFLLTKSLIGLNAVDAGHANPTRVVAEMARALRVLHSTSTRDCPFDQSVDVQLRRAYARMTASLVDEDDFDQARQGMRAQDVYEQLLNSRPKTEHLVVTHGDACPDNFIFLGDTFVGFIDCSRAGLADNYQDLALASRNIDAMFGPELTDLFFSTYGEPDPDQAKLEYYRILDELF